MKNAKRKQTKRRDRPAPLCPLTLTAVPKIIDDLYRVDMISPRGGRSPGDDIEQLMTLKGAKRLAGSINRTGHFRGEVVGPFRVTIEPMPAK